MGFAPPSTAPGNVSAVHILLATDADWIVAEVTAALGGPDTSFTVVRSGQLVAKVAAEREPDLVITDLQVGTMGGFAITLALRNDESVDALPHLPVVMLLDREADVYIAQRSDAEAWVIKPLDALRLRRAMNAALAGETYHEGVPVAPAPEPEATDGEEDPAAAEEETANAG
ncbi:response regulator receiver domain-containing protein [Ilumatobacter fluminis]|uniref:Response regulator receiver domain-containing protein n=1 Tax=Ilumatobacter fluminis TaxID=467091 RepID=A0A4R7HVW5_9ACTN|nr:response regulator receiver domain-containing protein [Ilumatobacter fluminis]